MDDPDTTADALVGMEIDLSNRDAWDDSALLSAFHASLSTHHTQGTPVPGDVRSAGKARGGRREKRSTARHGSASRQAAAGGGAAGAAGATGATGAAESYDDSYGDARYDGGGGNVHSTGSPSPSSTPRATPAISEEAYQYYGDPAGGYGDYSDYGNGSGPGGSPWAMHQHQPHHHGYPRPQHHGGRGGDSPYPHHPHHQHRRPPHHGHGPSYYFGGPPHHGSPAGASFGRGSPRPPRPPPHHRNNHYPPPPPPPFSFPHHGPGGPVPDWAPPPPPFGHFPGNGGGGPPEGGLASFPVPMPSGGPPTVGLGTDEDALANLLMAWYYSGYYTGRYQALQEAQRAAEKGDSTADE